MFFTAVIYYFAVVSFIQGGVITDCPPDKPPVQCLIDACEVTKCTNYPSARCISNTCGGCNAQYFIGDAEVTELCECPPDVPIVNCFADPCDVTSCSNYPNAKCVSNYCGGCNAYFFVDGIDVTNHCDCVEDQPLVQCFADPCDVSKCPNFPDATCLSNYCGGCRAWFFDDCQNVTDKCNGCPPDKPLVKCFADPCEVTLCNNYPNAKCVSNYCGGCNAQFFVDGIDVTKQCDCPAVCSPDVCAKNPLKKCTLPPNTPKEIPGCPGCDVTVCSACHFSIIDQPEQCLKLNSCPLTVYGLDYKCVQKWGRCLNTYLGIARTSTTGNIDDFQCWRPTCPLRG